MFERDGWRCRRCGGASRLECDYIIAQDQGGSAYELDNLQWPEIRRCNPLSSFPELRSKLLKERNEARRDSRLKARFLLS